MGKIIDLTGQKFHRLTVIEYCGLQDNRHAYWKCRCDCGNICYKMGYLLRNGEVKSCGCAQYDQRSKMGHDNGTTKKHILNDTINKNNTSGKKGVMWNKQRGRWQARIKYDYKQYSLYYGDSFEEAAKARDIAEEAVANGTFEDFISGSKQTWY